VLQVPERCSCAPASSRGASSTLPKQFGVPRLTPDDVVDLEDFRVTRMFERNVSQKRHDALAERLQLLPRVPHFAHQQLTIRMKGRTALPAAATPVRTSPNGDKDQSPDSGSNDCDLPRGRGQESRFDIPGDARARVRLPRTI
jgi:hypothetical protein